GRDLSFDSSPRDRFGDQLGEGRGAHRATLLNRRASRAAAALSFGRGPLGPVPRVARSPRTPRTADSTTRVISSAKTGVPPSRVFAIPIEWSRRMLGSIPN